jgi:hypothetical protein
MRTKPIKKFLPLLNPSDGHIADRGMLLMDTDHSKQPLEFWIDFSHPWNIGHGHRQYYNTAFGYTTRSMQWITADPITIAGCLVNMGSIMYVNFQCTFRGELR